MSNSQEWADKFMVAYTRFIDEVGLHPNALKRLEGHTVFINEQGQEDGEGVLGGSASAVIRDGRKLSALETTLMADIDLLQKIRTSQGAMIGKLHKENLSLRGVSLSSAVSVPEWVAGLDKAIMESVPAAEKNEIREMILDGNEIAALKKSAEHWEKAYRTNWRLIQNYMSDKTIAEVALAKVSKEYQEMAKAYSTAVAEITEWRNKLSDTDCIRDRLSAQLRTERLKTEKQQETINGQAAQIQDLKLKLYDCGERNTKLLKSGPWPLAQFKTFQVLEELRSYFPTCNEILPGSKMMDMLNNFFTDLTNPGQATVQLYDFRTMYNEEQQMRLNAEKSVEVLTNNKVIADRTISQLSEKIRVLEDNEDNGARILGVVQTARDVWKRKAQARQEVIDSLSKTTSSLTFKRICEFGQRWWPSSPDSNFETAFFSWYQEKYPTEQ